MVVFSGSMTPDVLQACLADPMALLNNLKHQHPRLPLSGFYLKALPVNEKKTRL